MLNKSQLDENKKIQQFKEEKGKKEKKELTPEESAYLDYANTKIDLVNHSVKTDDLGLLQFFYPDYKIMNKPSLFVDSPVIWLGDAKYLNTLKASGVNVISVTNLAEYSLLNKDILIQMTFTKWNKPVPKYVYQIKDLVDYDTILENVKWHWVTGKWLLKEFKSLQLFLDFISDLHTNKLTLLRSYFDLVNKTGVGYLDKSLMSFISRIVGISQADSDWYKKTANQYRTTKIQNVKPALDNYINSDIGNKELLTMNLISDLINVE